MKYKKGDRVEMTTTALDQWLDTGNKRYTRSTTGTVVFDQCGSSIIVIRDNRKTASRYHIKFWKLIEPKKDPAAVALGRKGGLKGGKARAEKLTKEQLSKIGKAGANARWGKE